MWWWTGSEWRPAISPDRRWRWTGAAWVPWVQQAAPRGGGAGVAVGIVLAFVGVIVFVSFFVVIILLTMGNQIKNVFDNVVTALGS
jgi:uncharacterized metal-binding protein